MKRIDLIKIGGFAPGENLMVAEVPEPEPEKGQVVISVEASAINPVDWKMAEYGFLLPESLPTALGCDVAGVVVKASDECQDMVGKRVVTYLGANKREHATDRGAYVQQVVADADLVGEVPDTMTIVQAATLPVGAMTAALLLNAVDLPSESFLLVWGASSSVGFNVVQLGIKRGLKPIAVASGKHKTVLEALGISGFVDYNKDNVEEKVKEICGDAKLNGAVDCIGAPSTFGPCSKLVRELGDSAMEKVVSTVNSVGLPDPSQGVKMSPVDLGTALDDRGVREKVVKATLPVMVQLETQPVRSVKGPFTADTVQEGFQTNKSGVSGEKVVIEWTE